MGRLVAHGWDYQAAKAHMGNWYRVPVGMGAGVMGVGYWCFAANVFLTVFQARLVRVPKPAGHLWKFFATGAAGLTVGTVQGVIQVQPANADWLYRAGHAGEWIDPISHAHINLVTGLTMLVAGGLLYLVPLLGGTPPVAPPGQRLLLRAARRLARLLRRRALPGPPRGPPGGRARADARAGRGGHAAPPLPDHGGRRGDARRLLAAALRHRPRLPPVAQPGAPVRRRGLRRARRGHAAGPGPGLPRRQRAARPQRRRRRRDREPARAAQHARRPDGHPDRAGAGAAAHAGRRQVAEPQGALRSPVGRRRAWPCTTPPASRSPRSRRTTCRPGRSFGAAVARLEPWPALVLVPAALAVLGGFGAYALGRLAHDDGLPRA